jgi:hypothetical protein
VPSDVAKESADGLYVRASIAVTKARCEVRELDDATMRCGRWSDDWWGGGEETVGGGCGWNRSDVHVRGGVDAHSGGGDVVASPRADRSSWYTDECCSAPLDNDFFFPS